MQTKKGKLILREILFLLIAVALAGAFAMFQTIGKEFAGESSSFIFSSTNYDYNVLIYVLGMALFLGGLLVTYHFLLKKYMPALKEESGIRVVFGVLAFLFSVVMLAVLAFALFAMVGMAGNLKPDWMMFFTVIGWPILTFTFMIGMMIRAK
ncbi:MAG: hypothetical protein IKQ49_06605 [Eubacterium sp.]|nr:hypothetical protein [Eubacterium sp.]